MTPAFAGAIIAPNIIATGTSSHIGSTSVTYRTFCHLSPCSVLSNKF
ncbi:uncharacterized protein METZ01_LOCUS312485 [marine metagenome]|uniref:Uncharacterized protein n=1 Tax=marine metagenome TaxID=408172 RepID=A0A382NJ65_9ZZZZ